MPRPLQQLQVDLCPFDLETGVRVTCNVGYLCANILVFLGLFVLDFGPMYATDDAVPCFGFRSTRSCGDPQSLQKACKRKC